MSRRIRILPDHLINQIAAGEVVERPASVVKELVENALDAGAARVEVGIKNGGKTEIRVADDGHGMGREDVLLALDRHATSKLREPSDLAAIRTLGFRGEALPSIASVSRMVLESSEREGDGTRMVVHGGRVDVVEGCARRVGTSVTVRSLFFNVPARAKFLRSAASEARAVSEVATTLALAHPEVAFRLESNGRDLLDVSPAPEVRSRIGALWGEALAAELIPVRHTLNGATITGWIERPHSATAAGRRSYLFVNGRAFADRFLVRAADRGYQTTLPPGVRPSLFLFLDVPEGEVDVNVHPTKAEVRFRDGIGIERLVEEGVRLALAPLESAAALGARSAPSPHGGYPAAPERPAELFPPVAEGATDQMSLFVTGARAQSGPGFEERDGGPRVQPAMWQVHNTYIFAETRSGLIVVDQHSAHERVLYEELMRSYDETPPDSQRLLFPITLRLSPAECAVIDQLSGLFARMGFEIEPLGGRSVIVQAVPVPHPYFDADRCLREMIAELTEGSPLVDSARNQHQRVALSFACKAAIKAGQRLSQQEMTELFDRLFATELPYHDIHGRPTIVELSLAELHNRFPEKRVSRPRPIAIVGPTASGKTTLAMEVAKRLGGEIVSVDSRQVYRGMDVGTAKATPAQRAEVPHHGLDLVDPDERFSAGEFGRRAREWIAEIEARGRIPVLVGGTGFFLRSLTHPIFSEPPLDAARREALAGWLSRLGTDALHAWLERLDPEAGARLGAWGGRQRLMRTLEVPLLTGRTLAWWQRETPAEAEPIELAAFVLSPPRDRLYRAIDERVTAMAEGGLLEEVEGLLRAGYDERAPGMSATGYAELIPVVRGEGGLEEALEVVRKRTRAYARRQLTWFRHQLPEGAVWLDAARPLEELVAEVTERAKREPLVGSEEA